MSGQLLRAAAGVDPATVGQIGAYPLAIALLAWARSVYNRERDRADALDALLRQQAEKTTEAMKDALKTITLLSEERGRR